MGISVKGEVSRRQGADVETNEAKLIEFTHIPPEAGVWRPVLHLGNRLIFHKGSEKCG